MWEWEIDMRIQGPIWQVESLSISLGINLNGKKNQP